MFRQPCHLVHHITHHTKVMRITESNANWKKYYKPVKVMQKEKSKEKRRK